MNRRDTKLGKRAKGVQYSDVRKRENMMTSIKTGENLCHGIGSVGLTNGAGLVRAR